MSAFDGSGRPGGMGGGPDLDDILASMFGMNMGGAGMPGFAGPGRRRKGPNEEQQYTVSLEDLYKGRTVKFASTKNVICTLCKGKGGKEKATPKKCSTCGGQGRALFWLCLLEIYVTNYIEQDKRRLWYRLDQVWSLSL